MTLVLIGPVCEDLIVIGDDKSFKVGGATYYQSFVYDEFYEDYLAIINTSNQDLAYSFPDESKVKIILKDDTHYFINEYPNKYDLDIRSQSTNFANIPISKEELQSVFDESNLNQGNIDAFVLNPLNSNDFPIETINFLRSFHVPIFISLQGFLRFKGENNLMILKRSENLRFIFEVGDTIFMDEDEFAIINDGQFHGSTLVITNGSKGSRIINVDGETIRINAVKCKNIVDATGCGDTYMAAYILARLNHKNLNESADFASLIASRKLESFGPYKNFKR